MKKLFATVALAAAAFGTALAAQVPAEAWRIGPIIKGRNYSVGMPPAMQEGRQGPEFQFPANGRGHVHYVTLNTGSIEGARAITVRYRIDAAPGARFIAQENGEQGTIGLSFQRAGDNWSGRGRFESYRWYSPLAAPLSPGVHTFTARLDDPRWVAVMGTQSGANPAGFRSALADAESVSMTFGSSGRRGHGVYSTAPARFTLLNFRID